MRKAQSSLELLIVLAGFFAFLAAWLPVANSIRSQGEAALSLTFAELALSDLANAGDEAFILGSGNSREIRMRLRGNAELSFSSGNAAITSNGAVLSRQVRFASSSRLDLRKGISCIMAENAGGEIRFTEVPCTGAR